MSGLGVELPPWVAWLELDRQRRAARESFLERAGRWVAGRGGRVRLPEDRAALIALGVPCEHCGAVVTEDGQGGHLIELGFAGGQRFGASIVARCGQGAGLPLAVVSSPPR
ncbi:hypothetical protein ACIBTV_27700 [Micromonospora sp. NPDC049366]|uniref:hypothetical protein n=1 Tax=Micromonospora sp. NPDC049366 TaxID=3364271 RepID=UPI0037BAFCCA